MGQRTVLLHCHIFKNAGSSFDSELARIFGDRFYEFLPHEETELKAKPQSLYDKFELLKLSAVSGHRFYRKPDDTKDFKLMRVLFFRHPLRRAWSAYQFQRRQEVERAEVHAARRLSFSDFTEWRLEEGSEFKECNLQATFLMNEGRRCAPKAEHKEVLRQLLIAEPLVGVVELYPESMVVFNEALLPVFPGRAFSQRRENASPSNVRSVSLVELENRLGDSVRDRFMSENALDYFVWQQARSLVLERLRSVESYPSKLARVL